ncbi:MAG: hypothetical protein Q4C75_00960 [Bergeyella zoohelcum]|nr:hypothetical protein [Bergeyella zoohelcum]
MNLRKHIKQIFSYIAVLVVLVAVTNAGVVLPHYLEHNHEHHALTHEEEEHQDCEHTAHFQVEHQHCDCVFLSSLGNQFFSPEVIRIEFSEFYYSSNFYKKGYSVPTKIIYTHQLRGPPANA